MGGCVGGAGGGGGGSRARPAAGRVARRGGPASALAPFPVPGRAVLASAGGLPLPGAHAQLSACVARGTPTRCGSESWVSSGRCPSPAVCGFPAVWVVCRGVRCGLSLVDWGVGGAGAGRRRMPHGRWRPALGDRPRRRPPRHRASPAPFFLADCGRLSVGWVSCWT